MDEPPLSDTFVDHPRETADMLALLVWMRGGVSGEDERTVVIPQSVVDTMPEETTLSMARDTSDPDPSKWTLTFTVRKT